jgi:IMP cyclohydrolase
MATVKVNYENGDYECTRINATLEEARAYYIGKTFNIGSVSDNLQKCTSVEIMED